MSYICRPVEPPPPASHYRWGVFENTPLGGGQPVDLFRSLRTATDAMTSLNRGTAVIEAHRPLGCRIVPRFVPRGPIHDRAVRDRVLTRAAELRPQPRASEPAPDPAYCN